MSLDVSQKSIAYQQAFIKHYRSDAETNFMSSNEITSEQAKAQVTRLIKNAISSVYPTIVGFPIVGLDKTKNIFGKFRSKNGRIFDYKITPTNQLSYKEIIREDSRFDDGQDDCKVGNPCKGQCISRMSQCLTDLPPITQEKVNQARSLINQQANEYLNNNPEKIAELEKTFRDNPVLVKKAKSLAENSEEIAIKAEKAQKLLEKAKKFEKSASAADREAARLVNTTFETGDLPSRKEASNLLGIAAKETIRNPIKGVKQGLEREAFMREAIELASNIDASRRAVMVAGAKNAGAAIADITGKNFKSWAEEGSVGAAGAIGGLSGAAIGGLIGATVAGPVGTAVGGFLGEKAADVGGSLIVRKAITNFKAHKSALSKLNEDEAFAAADKLTKKKLLKKQTLSELEAMAEAIRDNRIEDVGGWMIGNTAAHSLQAVGVKIPLEGAAVAMATTKTAAGAYKRVKAGEKTTEVVREIVAAPIVKTKASVKAGDQREEELRRRTKQTIEQYKKYAPALASEYANAVSKK
jgi:hypothetical protein